MVRPIKVDIIGGSLGGCSTAISLKEHDPSIKVVIHEKYKEIGYNHEGRRCGEAHTVEREWMKWRPQGKSIFNTITKGEFIIGKKHYYAREPPGSAFILNRQEFICQLAREAKKLGAVLHTNDKIKSIDDLDGDYIVDASGCPSSIKRQLGLPMRFVGSTYQQTIEDANCFVADTMKIIFTSHFGYFWIFPRNPEKKEVNVGIGTLGTLEYDLKKILEVFKEEQKITGNVNYITGGLVSLGLQPPFMYRHILFVGDAGVGAFPLSGQGIYRALLSGDIAGRCLANRQPKTYSANIRKEFLKWDMIGSMFIKMNRVLKEINPELFLTSYNVLATLSKRFQSLTY
jgi:flavin-dependent dehydrogenase